MNKKSLIIGYGSIGRRHANILAGFGHKVGVVTRRESGGFESYSDISEALEAFEPEYIVICNRTSEHFQTVKRLSDLGFSGTVLVEKPLFESVHDPGSLPFNLFVAYNLRFHPIIRKIYDLTRTRPLYSMHVYCGQHLATWRTDRDYTRCYSASKKMGGGVLRDLSHELDYVNWITGGWKRVSALGGRVSDLRIDSDDVFCLLMETRLCPAVTLQVNYLDTSVKREIILNCAGDSIRADLVSGFLDVGSGREGFNLERDSTYRAEHMAVLDDRTECIPDFEGGMEIMRLIEAAEKASEKQVWIRNPK